MDHWVKTKKKNEEAENQFSRLPDDVVLNIFDKVSDIKWLCRCFMVAKRFSSLSPRVQTLSVNSNAWVSLLKSRSDSQNETENYPESRFLGKFSKFIRDKNTIFPPIRFYAPEHIRFYGNEPLPVRCCRLNYVDMVFQLKQIQSLNLEVMSDYKGDDGSDFKWGANCLAGRLDSVSFFYAKSLSKMIESEAEEDDALTENEIAEEERRRRVELACTCFSYAAWWVLLLPRLLNRFPMLESVTITDWKNKGVRLCLGGEKLAEFRNPLEKTWRYKVRDGYVPVLHLPICGIVMKEVTNVQFRHVGEDFEADEALLDAFTEEKGPFLEAVMQILEKIKDSSKALCKN